MRDLDRAVQPLWRHRPQNRAHWLTLMRSQLKMHLIKSRRVQTLSSYSCAQQMKMRSSRTNYNHSGRAISHWRHLRISCVLATSQVLPVKQAQVSWTQILHWRKDRAPDSHLSSSSTGDQGSQNHIFNILRTQLRNPPLMQRLRLPQKLP